MAGSGFYARITYNPTNVSFMRTKFREEETKAIASGYYEEISQDGRPHKTGVWNTVRANNEGDIADDVGTSYPGTPGPFDKGIFTWNIPQNFKAADAAGQRIPVQYSCPNPDHVTRRGRDNRKRR